VLADDVEREPRLVGLGRGEQPLRDGAAAGGGAPRRLADDTAQDRRKAAAARLLDQRGAVEAHGDEQRLAGAQRRVEQRQRRAGEQRGDAAAGEARDVLVGELAGDAGRLRPQAPGQRGRGAAGGAAALGQRVERGVRRGVVGLSGRADDPGDGGEEDERRELAVGGQVWAAVKATEVRTDPE